MSIMLKIVKGLVILVGGYVVLLIVVGIFGAGSSGSGSIRRGLEHEGGRVIASDLIEQYDFLVKNGGSPMEICVHAGAVASAFMGASDAQQYKEWKAIQRRDCARAGIPSGN